MYKREKNAGPKTENPLELGEFLCFAVYAANHAFNRLYQPLLAKLGLTYPQYLVMVSMWENDDQTVGSLGIRLLLESSTLTPLLKRLEKMELITRERDKVDERQVRINLTPKGKALRASARDIPACVLEASGLEPDQLRRLKRELELVRKNLYSPIAAP